MDNIKKQLSYIFFELYVCQDYNEIKKHVWTALWQLSWFLKHLGTNFIVDGYVSTASSQPFSVLGHSGTNSNVWG